ncbi:TPA: NAD-dependent epimerase/dehydratase family protein [Candidatus Dojkabacteria bacterium]|uniref:NAD-dependent epimerase/dehydratase family protein n=1 Tax=Candidatus Dojkabacteria bacterium TaxID=2099670 RepID=A0A832R8S8_9BACT|nr:NAD-dependent epimerase/dehydratase family protein [Candidatus Dojkabacteria bacterium]
MVIVTGGSGHVGNVLVRALLSKGYKVGVIDRDPRDKALKGLDIEYHQGDIRDLDFLTNIFKKAKYVCHLAGIISIAPGKEKLMYDVNVEGTKTVIEACKKAKVKRLLYTSSIHALYEPPKGIPIIEKLAKITGIKDEYGKTKVLATREVLAAAKEGLNTVVVYPTGIAGPYDFRHSEFGSLIKDARKYSKVFYIEGGYNFVDVRDVANGIILALEKGRTGEGYLLAGQSITIFELFQLLAKITDTPGPKIKAPTCIIKFLAPIAEFFYKLLKKKPVFTEYAIEVLHSNHLTDSSKAEKELGFKARDIHKTIQDTLDWYEEKEVEIQ